MTKTVCAIFLGALLLAVPAAAEPIPDYVLDKDFVTCMGGEEQNIQRRDYCMCVREGMRSWTLEQYGQIALAESKGINSPSQEPAQLQVLAQSCLTKATGRRN